MIYIYALREMGTEAIRWVGQTSNLKRRLRAHRNAKHGVNNPEKVAWVESVNRNIEIIVIDEVSDAAADAREAHWIRQYRAAGCALLNIKPGGKTCRGYTQTEAANAKRRRAMTGKHHSEATRLKLSQGHKSNPDIVNRMREIGRQRKGQISNRKGVTLSPETRLKISLNSSHHTQKTKKLSTLQEIEIIKKLKHNTAPHVGAEYGVSQWVIYDMLERRGIKLTKLREENHGNI